MESSMFANSYNQFSPVKFSLDITLHPKSSLDKNSSTRKYEMFTQLRTYCEKQEIT